MQIGAVDLATHVLIVAEIGNNHEGRFDVAQELVRRAATCRVDAVKFQTFRTEHFVSPSDAARFKRLKSFELSADQVSALAAQARELGLLFLSTPLDLGSADLLEPLVDAFKIASGDNDFLPLIQRVAASGKPLIISTGASDFPHVQRLVHFIESCWAAQGRRSELALLHCVSSYPVPPDQANLRSIRYLADRLPQVTVGYSDHTIGIEAPVLSVALGARLVEKHFTLDHQFSDFRDHQLSADPDEMARLVERIRLAEQLLGSYDKSVQPAEAPVVSAVRRSVVAAADLPAGHRLAAEDLTWIRPAGGLAPGQEAALLGKPLKRPVKTGQRLDLKDV